MQFRSHRLPLYLIDTPLLTGGRGKHAHCRERNQAEGRELPLLLLLANGLGTRRIFHGISPHCPRTSSERNSAGDCPAFFKAANASGVATRWPRGNNGRRSIAYFMELLLEGFGFASLA